MGERGEARPAWGEVIDDQSDEDDLDDTGLVIIEEKPRPATRQRVRYPMPETSKNLRFLKITRKGTQRPVEPSKTPSITSCFNNLHRPFSETIRGVSTSPDDSDPLAAEPAALTGHKIGYARVSTGSQRLDRQMDALAAAGCRRVFADKKSGKTADRPELAAALDFMQPGDTLVVPSLDRLSRSLQDLITMVSDLRKRQVEFTSLHENLDTTTPGGRLIFHVFAALAEFIRELIVSGTREGLAAARTRGRVGGRPTVITPEILRAARDMLPNPDNSIESIAKILGVSPGTLYNHIPDLRELRTSRHTTKPDTIPRPRRAQITSQPNQPHPT